ncbi:MAG: cupredoxin domain-containing protein [Candidatus Roizmanbacteria bacterium]
MKNKEEKVIAIIYFACFVFGCFLVFYMYKKANPLIKKHAVKPTPIGAIPLAQVQKVRPTVSIDRKPIIVGFFYADKNLYDRTGIIHNNLSLISNDGEFVPNIFHVKKDELLVLTLQNKGSYHDLNIPDYGIHTHALASDKELTIVFSATQSGKLEFYSQTKLRKEPAIKGTLIVE